MVLWANIWSMGHPEHNVQSSYYTKGFRSTHQLPTVPTSCVLTWNDMLGLPLYRKQHHSLHKETTCWEHLQNVLLQDVYPGWFLVETAYHNVGKSALLHFLDVYETCVELQQSHCQKPEIMYILINCIIIHTILHTDTVHISDFYTTKQKKDCLLMQSVGSGQFQTQKNKHINFRSCCVQLLMFHVLNTTVWAYKLEGKDREK